MTRSRNFKKTYTYFVLYLENDRVNGKLPQS